MSPGTATPGTRTEARGVCWTERGLGLWVHPKSLQYLRDISRLDDPDRWVPIATVLPNLPDFVTAPGVPTRS